MNNVFGVTFKENGKVYYFKSEMDYYEDKDKVASGKQSKEYDEAADLYAKVRKAYNDWDNI